MTLLGSHVMDWQGKHGGTRKFEIYHPWSCPSSDGDSHPDACDVDYELATQGDDAFGWDDENELDMHQPDLFVVERWTAGDDSALELAALPQIVLVLAGNLHQAHLFVKSLYFPLPKSKWKYVKNPNDLAGIYPGNAEFWQVGTPKFALADFCASQFKVTAVLA